MAVELKEQIKGIIWGEPSSYTGQLKNLLSNVNIFGINLITKQESVIRLKRYL